MFRSRVPRVALRGVARADGLREELAEGAEEYQDVKEYKNRESFLEDFPFSKIALMGILFVVAVGSVTALSLWSLMFPWKCPSTGP